MPEYEAWPGQIEATRMLFDTLATSKKGPRCYQHGKRWRKDCTWCDKAKEQDVIWKENKAKAVVHEERLRSGEWSVINLAIELNDHLFDRRFGSKSSLPPEELLEWAFKLAAKVREQAPDVNYPLIEQYGQSILDEFRAAQSGQTLSEPTAPLVSDEGRSRLSSLADAEQGG